MTKPKSIILLNCLIIYTLIIFKLKRLAINFVCIFIVDKEKRHSLRYDFLFKNIKIETPYIYSLLDTIKLLQQGKSIARFGDCELMYLSTNSKEMSFQHHSVKFKIRLREILKDKQHNVNCLVAIPSENSTYIKEGHSFNLNVRYIQLWKENKYRFIKYLNMNYKYADAIISREVGVLNIPLEKYRKIWENKKVCFVYSKKGRFEIEPRLFDNIKEYVEIDIPPVNAFDTYDEILEKCKQVPKDYIFIIAAGATATILAYDLSFLGYQALDIGHLPNCYRQIIDGEVSPEAMVVVKN